MGNNSSRVAPTNTLHIFDNQTRARYKNQREANLLRRKLRAIDAKGNDALSRLTFDEQDDKLKLHELQYDKVQRQLFKSIETHREEKKKPSPAVFSVAHLDTPSSNETTNLLLHQIYESMAHEKTITIPIKPESASNKAKSETAFAEFQAQYSSKTDTNRKPVHHTERYLISHARTLQRETEQMKKSIKTSVAKATRDSNIVARHDARHY